ncbi:MAG TPA: GNAT family N-acetyltransferase [Capillimicrobium sp.]|nr:GNAT family N-acetyltransferase [Capillimicrobium sp.]
MAIVFPLTTERLSIRPFTEADRETMRRIYADPDVMRFIDTRGEDPATWVDGYIAHQASHGYAFWAIEERATGELLGEAGFGPLDGVGPELELGYLLRHDAWGRGLATEAARACLDAAFGGLGVREVVAVVDIGNDASLRVLWKVGFRVEGWRTAHGRRQHVLRAVAGDGLPA